MNYQTSGEFSRVLETLRREDPDLAKWAEKTIAERFTATQEGQDLLAALTKKDELERVMLPMKERELIRAGDELKEAYEFMLLAQKNLEKAKQRKDRAIKKVQDVKQMRWNAIKEEELAQTALSHYNVDGQEISSDSVGSLEGISSSQGGSIRCGKIGKFVITEPFNQNRMRFVFQRYKAKE